MISASLTYDGGRFSYRYGKVVIHLRLMARMRRAVGMECVKSRDQIAKKALFALESELELAPAKTANGHAKGENGKNGSSSSGGGGGGSSGSNGSGSNGNKPASGSKSPSTKSLSTKSPGKSAVRGKVASPAATASSPAATSASPVAPTMIRGGPFSGVEFMEADATAFDRLPYASRSRLTYDLGELYL